MLLKFLWFFVLLWIASRVYRSARNLFHIASGRIVPPDEGPSSAGSGSFRPPFGQPDGRPTPQPASSARRPQVPPQPTQERASERPAASSPPRLDVEDARFEDLP